MSGQVQVRNDDLVTLLRSEFPRSPWGCAFLVRRTTGAATVTGDGTGYQVDFNSEIFDLGNDFATPWFTAPQTGGYFLRAAVHMSALAANHTTGLLRLLTSNRQYYTYEGFSRAANNYGLLTIAALCDMDAGDSVRVYLNVYNGAKVVNVIGHASIMYTWFSGHRVF